MKSYARRSLFPEQIAWRKSEETDAAPSDTHMPGSGIACLLALRAVEGDLLRLTPISPVSWRPLAEGTLGYFCRPL